MSSSEYLDQSPKDNRDEFLGWNESDWLNSLTPEELIKNISDQWEHCDRSFKALFTQLNSVSIQPMSTFDIKVESKVVGTATIETYIRLWKDGDANNIQRFISANGSVIDRSETERFDKRSGYEMLQNMRGNLTIRGDDIDPDVYLNDLKYKVYPSVVNTGDTLITLWDAVADESLNPVHAQAYRLFFQG